MKFRWPGNANGESETENLAKEGASARRGGRKNREKIYGNPAMKGKRQTPVIEDGVGGTGRKRGIGGGKEQIKEKRQKVVELKVAMDEDRACHKPHNPRGKYSKQIRISISLFSFS